MYRPPLSVTSVVTTVWAVFCLLHSLHISTAGRLWNAAPFVLPTASLSSSFKTGGRLCHSLCLSPDDRGDSLSLLTSKPHEEILSNPRDGRKRGCPRRGEKAPLWPLHSSLSPRTVGTALGEDRVWAMLWETHTQVEVFNLHSGPEAESCRAQCWDTQKGHARPSPGRCRGNLWV